MSRFIITQNLLAENARAFPEGPRIEACLSITKTSVLNGQTQTHVLAFVLIVLGTRLGIIDSVCICWFAFVRVLLNLVSVSFKCRYRKNEGRGGFCGFGY